MAILRHHALSQLAECIAEHVPALKGRICAGPAESPQRLSFPSLSIIPVRFRYFPDQAATHQTVGATSVVLNVGRHEGTVQLRLGAQTHRQRTELEERVLDVFLGQLGRPGVLLTTVPLCHDATVAWELDTDEWDSEKAFDKKMVFDSDRCGPTARSGYGGWCSLDRRDSFDAYRRFANAHRKRCGGQPRDRGGSVQRLHHSGARPVERIPYASTPVHQQPQRVHAP